MGLDLAAVHAVSRRTERSKARRAKLAPDCSHLPSRRPRNITLAGVLTLPLTLYDGSCVSNTGSSYLPRRRRDHCVVDRGEPQLAVSSPGPEAAARAIAARGGGSGARRCGGSRNASD